MRRKCVNQSEKKKPRMYIRGSGFAVQMIEAMESRTLLSAALVDQDIGAPPIAGSASYDSPSDTYTVTGSGAGIGGNSDQFNFDGTTMSGNGTIAAFVNSLSNTSSAPQAGVMIRNDASVGWGQHSRRCWSRREAE